MAFYTIILHQNPKLIPLYPLFRIWLKPAQEWMYRGYWAGEPQPAQEWMYRGYWAGEPQPTQEWMYKGYWAGGHSPPRNGCIEDIKQVSHIDALITFFVAIWIIFYPYDLCAYLSLYFSYIVWLHRNAQLFYCNKLFR